MKFILSYVNKNDDTTANYDREFLTMVSLMRFAEQEHCNWTSYQIIVVRGK